MCQPNLLTAISAILYDLDPMGLARDGASDPDEYESEAAAIVSVLPTCRSQDDLAEKTWRVFCSSFSNASAGGKQDYSNVAKRIWLVWTDCERAAGKT